MSSAPKDLIGFIVAHIEPAFTHQFMTGLVEHVTDAAAHPNDQNVIAALDRYVYDWYLSAWLLHDPEFIANDAADPQGPALTTSELRARLNERRRLAKLSAA